MAWSTPLTAVADAALTAAQWNSSVRDNLLETAVARASQSGSIFAGAGVNSLAERFPFSTNAWQQETTASTAYTNLTTVGPTVTVTSGTRILISVTATTWNNTTGVLNLVGLEITGASPLTPLDTLALRSSSPFVNSPGSFAGSYVHIYGVTAGTSTYQTKYRVTGGIGTFDDRRISGIPF